MTDVERIEAISNAISKLAKELEDLGVKWWIPRDLEEIADDLGAEVFARNLSL